MSVMMGFNGTSGGPNMGGGGDLIFPHAPSDLSPHGLGPHPGGGGGGGGGVGVGSGVVDDSQLERRGLDSPYGLDASGGLGGMHGPRGGIGDGSGGALCPQLDSPYPPSPHNLSSDMDPALDPSESATSINNNLRRSSNNNTVSQHHLDSHEQRQQELRDAITGAGIGVSSSVASSKPRRRRRTPPLAHIDLQDTSLYSVYCFVKSFLSASNASTVAIDNKIEQAMDLVKSHLMFAVREEVEVLKEKIGELMDRISQLEYENTVLRQCATQDALQQIAQPHPNSNT